MLKDQPSKHFNCGHEDSLRTNADGAEKLREELNKFHKDYSHQILNRRLYYSSVPMFASMKTNLELDWMQVNHFNFSDSSAILSFLWLIAAHILTTFHI